LCDMGWGLIIQIQIKYAIFYFSKLNFENLLYFLFIN
jgi:hypothetical protein